MTVITIELFKQKFDSNNNLDDANCLDMYDIATGRINNPSLHVKHSDGYCKNGIPTTSVEAGRETMENCERR